MVRGGHPGEEMWNVTRIFCIDLRWLDVKGPEGIIKIWVKNILFFSRVVLEFSFKLRAIPGIHFKRLSKTCVAWLSFGFVI